jgi:type I restriction enzyme R subunit
VVVAQVDNNSREQALRGNLPGAVQQGVVRALTSHQKLATLVLKSDRQAMAALTDLIYDLLSEKRVIDLGGFDQGRPTAP